MILCSYEADFAASWGRKARSVLEEYGPAVFGVTVSTESHAANRWGLQKHTGEMITAGVGGPITGRGAGLLLIDDPVKNAEEANSVTFRDRAWEWYMSTAYTRLEPGGKVVLVMTRWHADDLVGRILGQTEIAGEHWEVIRLVAIAESDELGRGAGEALWPERYPLEVLEKTRTTIGPYYWAALYQQRPAAREGNFFKRQWFAIVEAAPVEARRVRYWDKAATAGGGARTAGIMIAYADGIAYVEDVVKGQWSSGERNKLMLQVAQLDAARHANTVHIWTEQEPGSGGKESAEATIMMLAGYPVHKEPVTGSKEVRAEPFAAQCEAGNVRLVKGAWNYDYLEEICAFPNSTFKDQVDASSGAFNKLAGSGFPAAGASVDRQPVEIERRTMWRR